MRNRFKSCTIFSFVQRIWKVKISLYDSIKSCIFYSEPQMFRCIHNSVRPAHGWVSACDKFYCMFADRIHSLQEEKAVYRVCLVTWGGWGVWGRWEGSSHVTGHIRPPPLPHGHLGIIPPTPPPEPSLQTMSYPTTWGPTATFLETANWSSTERLLELVLELWVVNTSHEQHRFGDVASNEETEWSIQHQGDLWRWYFWTSH